MIRLRRVQVLDVTQGVELGPVFLFMDEALPHALRTLDEETQDASLVIVLRESVVDMVRLTAHDLPPGPMNDLVAKALGSPNWRCLFEVYDTGRRVWPGKSLQLVRTED